MIPSRVVIASKNPDKIVEVEEVLASLGLGIEIVRDQDWPDVEETAPTLAGNALLKARAVVTATRLAALADDTGLEVDALEGAPGVHSSRYAGPDASYAANRSKLLEALGDRPDRAARFRTVVALAYPDGSAVTADGSVEGQITTAERGTRGFGYDAIFEVDGRTLAEMTAAEKHGMSHRARALRALAARLGVPEP